MKYFLLICLLYFSYLSASAQVYFIGNKMDSLNEELCKAAFNGSVLKAEKAIKLGANVNTYSDNGVTPLLYAVEHNDYNMAKFLLENKANPDTKSNTYSGDYPLLLAVELGYTKMVELLIQYNADINKQNRTGLTALHYAAFFNDTTIAKILIRKNVLFESNSIKKETPLFYAASNGSTGVLILLLAAGANPDCIDKSGYTPLMIASQNGHINAVYELLLTGANINLRNRKGYSALSYAIYFKNNEIVDLLLLNNANYNENNSISINPLAIAKIADNKPVIDSLRKIGATRNFLPCFRYAGSIGFDFRANNKDFLTGITITPYDIKYRFEYSLFYFIRPFAIPVLKELDKSTHIQYWERRHIIGISLAKRVEIAKNNNSSLNLSAGLSYEFQFGRYRGTLIPNEDGFFLSPQASILYSYKRFDYRLRGQYLRLTTTGLPNWYVTFSVHWNFKRKFMKNREIVYIRYKK